MTDKKEKKDDKDCGCISLRWRLFLAVVFALIFGILIGEIGRALGFGGWLGAFVGAGFGGWIGWHVNARSFEDMFFWLRKDFWKKK